MKKEKEVNSKNQKVVSLILSKVKTCFDYSLYCIKVLFFYLLDVIIFAFFVITFLGAIFFFGKAILCLVCSNCECLDCTSKCLIEGNFFLSLVFEVRRCCFYDYLAAFGVLSTTTIVPILTTAVTIYHYQKELYDKIEEDLVNKQLLFKFKVLPLGATDYDMRALLRAQSEYQLRDKCKGTAGLKKPVNIRDFDILYEVGFDSLVTEAYNINVVSASLITTNNLMEKAKTVIIPERGKLHKKEKKCKCNSSAKQDVLFTVYDVKDNSVIKLFCKTKDIDEILNLFSMEYITGFTLGIHFSLREDGNFPMIFPLIRRSINVIKGKSNENRVVKIELELRRSPCDHDAGKNDNRFQMHVVDAKFTLPGIKKQKNDTV